MLEGYDDANKIDKDDVNDDDGDGDSDCCVVAGRQERRQGREAW